MSHERDNQTTAIVAAPLIAMLLEGGAQTLHKAQELYLSERIPDVVALAQGPLSGKELRRHHLISPLLARGSRGWEDSLV